MHGDLVKPAVTLATL